MSPLVTATTRLAAVIGDPVRHSKSPVIHNAAFAACDVDAVYLALPVPEGSAGQAIEAMRTFDWLGLSVTMPHKQAAMQACDVLTPTARALGAVNCVYWNNEPGSERGSTVAGDSTDGEGFIRGLAADLDVSVAGLRCVVVGAGGAAAAVAYALADHGAADVAVVNRTELKAQTAAALAGEVGRVGTIDDLSSADLVINATPIGMGSTPHVDEVPFDVDRLSVDAVVCDLIYHPAETRLLAAAKARGLRAQNGLPMLVYQAAVAFEHWTGLNAPIEAMTAAVLS